MNERKTMEADALWDDLQRAWDEESARVDALCGQYPLRTGNWKPVRSSRRKRLLRRCAAVAAADVVVVLWCLIGLPQREGYDGWLMLSGGMIALLAAVTAIMAASATVRLRRQDAARLLLGRTVRAVDAGFVQRAITVSAAAAVMACFVSIAMLGDGYSIASHGMDRMYAVASVDRMISLMS